MEAYKILFGTELKQYLSPLDKGDHPEIDDSPELNSEDYKKYLTMVGQLQWLILLGHFDVAAAVMTLSRFCMAPREGPIKKRP